MSTTINLGLWAGILAGRSWRSLGCFPEGADVTRERAISVAEVTQPGFTGLPLHTSRYLDEPVCPPIIICMFSCNILFFMLMAFVTSYLYLVLV